MVEKLVLNVLADTVLVAAPALFTSGNMAMTKLPTSATDARALPVLKFILPNPSVVPRGTDCFWHFMVVS
ncbi:MAG: hypothetical protein ACYC5Z_01315 [Acidimicrobiales bacterium]